jgi:hypothetical protein
VLFRSLLGTGGGGWNASYHKYQSYLYYTDQLHNYLLQVGVETGLPGMIAFLCIWYYFFDECRRLWLLCRKNQRCGEEEALPPDNAAWSDNTTVRPAFSGVSLGVSGVGQPGADCLAQVGAVQGTVCALAAGVLCVGARLLFDSSMSLGAVSLFLWGDFGLTRGLGRLYGSEGDVRPRPVWWTQQLERYRQVAAGLHYRGNAVAEQPGRGRRFGKGMQAAAVSLAVLLAVSVSAALLLGLRHGKAADEALRQGRTALAIRELQQAVRWDMWTAGYRASLAGLLLDQAVKSGNRAENAQLDYTRSGNGQTENNGGTQTAQTGGSQAEKSVSQTENARNVQNGNAQVEYAIDYSRAKYAQAEELTRAAVGRKKGDAGLRLTYARILFGEGKNSQGVAQLEEASELQPFDQQTYDNLSRGYWAVGMAALSSAEKAAAAKQRKQGREYLLQALELPQRISSRMARVPREQLALWDSAPLLTPSTATWLRAGKAAVLLGRNAGPYLRQAAKDPSLQSDLLLWQGLESERLDPGSGGMQIDQALQLNPDLKQEYRQALAIIRGR